MLFLRFVFGLLYGWKIQTWPVIRFLSHFILGGRNCNVLVFILYCKTLLLMMRWDTGEVRDRFGGMGMFKGGVNSVTCMYTIIALYQIVNLNVSTQYLRPSNIKWNQDFSQSEVSELLIFLSVGI